MGKLGVFAERLVAPAQACYPIPDDVPMGVAALIGCCVTTGVGAVMHTPDVRPGSTVAVFGCGGVGLNVVQGAALMNASRVIAVDIHDHKLEFARGFGATDTVNATKVDPVAAVKELTDGGADFAYEVYGASETTSNAINSLGKGGTGVVVGLAAGEETAPIDLVDLVRNQKRILGCYYGFVSPHESFRTMVDLYRSDRLNVDGLIQRRYKLDEIDTAFEALARGEDGRGIIDFDQ